MEKTSALCGNSSMRAAGVPRPDEHGLACMRLVSCVWRPGSGTQWVSRRPVVGRLQAAVRHLLRPGPAAGRPRGRGRQVQRRLAAGTGDQKVHHNLSWDEFKQKDSKHFDDGLRLVDIEIDDGKYAGVWQPGTGTQWVRIDMTEDQFVDQDTTYFDEGLRITDIELVGSKYAAVWRPGTGTSGFAQAGRRRS